MLHYCRMALYILIFIGLYWNAKEFYSWCFHYYVNRLVRIASGIFITIDRDKNVLYYDGKACVVDYGKKTYWQAIYACGDNVIVINRLSGKVTLYPDQEAVPARRRKKLKEAEVNGTIS